MSVAPVKASLNSHQQKPKWYTNWSNTNYQIIQQQHEVAQTYRSSSGWYRTSGLKVRLALGEPPDRKRFGVLK